MSITQIDDPARTANAGSASFWVASDNSIDFIFQRKDVNPWGFVNSGGNLRVNLPSGNYTDQAGNYVYINDIANVYTGTHRVSSGGVSYVILETTYVSATAGFLNFVGKFPQYYLRTWVYESGTDRLLDFFDSIADPSGKIRVDVGHVIRQELSSDIEFPYEMINKGLEDQTIKFYIKYQEYRDDASGDVGSVISQGDTFYAIKAVKQIGEQYGQNMRDYVIYAEAISNKAKFLGNRALCYWPDFPFSLSFIYSEFVDDKKYNRHVDQLDINKSSLTTDDKYLSDVYKEMVNDLTLRNFGTLNANTRWLYVWIEETDEPTDDNYGGGGGSTSGGGTGTGIAGGDSAYMDDDYAGG